MKTHEVRELGHVTDPPCREQGLRLSFPLAGLASAQEVAIAGSALASTQRKAKCERWGLPFPLARRVSRGVAYNEGVGNVGGGIF